MSVSFMYVCEACHVSIRKAMKCKDKGEQYQLKWLKRKKVSKCCVPSCKSVDIKAKRHEFTRKVISLASHTLQSPRERGSGNLAYTELCQLNLIIPYCYVTYIQRSCSHDYFKIHTSLVVQC